ncbi:MAG: class I SAM-dependent methyltransferase [Caldilineaceae bacterium]|nr:class I SAM-dependent methyltransferase [Caldilineaceae bacterium]
MDGSRCRRGRGSYLPLIAELVGPRGAIHALDLASENVEHLQRRVQQGEFDCPVEVRKGSVTDLPYADNSMDAVWCANVVLTANHVDGGDGISAAARTLGMPARLANAGFDDIRYESVVSECRQPLSAVQRAYFRAITPFWYRVAQQSDLSEATLERWRLLLGEVDGPNHVLERADFHHREIHGLVVGTVPPAR